MGVVVTITITIDQADFDRDALVSQHRMLAAENMQMQTEAPLLLCVRSNRLLGQLQLV